MLEIRRMTVAEFSEQANLPKLLADYANESSMPELGPIASGEVAEQQRRTYLALEAAGALHPIGAFDGERMVGFIMALVSPLPHYGVIAMTIESYFVEEEARSSGAGMQLLRFAELLGADLDAKALLVSAPVGSVLATVMSMRGSYRHSNAVFVKALT